MISLDWASKVKAQALSLTLFSFLFVIIDERPNENSRPTRLCIYRRQDPIPIKRSALSSPLPPPPALPESSPPISSTPTHP